MSLIDKLRVLCNTILVGSRVAVFIASEKESSNTPESISRVNNRKVGSCESPIYVPTLRAAPLNISMISFPEVSCIVPGANKRKVLDVVVARLVSNLKSSKKSVERNILRTIVVLSE